MMAHLFGQILDIEPDAKAGRRTTAVFLGARPAKLLLVGFLGALALLTGVIFKSLVLCGFFTGTVAWFLLDAFVLWKDSPYTAGQTRLFGQGLNVMAIASIPYMWWTGVLTHLP